MKKPKHGHDEAGRNYEPDTDLIDAPLCAACVMDAVRDCELFNDGFKAGELRIAFDRAAIDIDFHFGKPIGEVGRTEFNDAGTQYRDIVYRVVPVGLETAGSLDCVVVRLEEA